MTEHDYDPRYVRGTILVAVMFWVSVGYLISLAL